MDFGLCSFEHTATATLDRQHARSDENDGVGAQNNLTKFFSNATLSHSDTTNDFLINATARLGFYPRVSARGLGSRNNGSRRSLEDITNVGIAPSAVYGNEIPTASFANILEASTTSEDNDSDNDFEESSDTTQSVNGGHASEHDLEEEEEDITSEENHNSCETASQKQPLVTPAAPSPFKAPIAPLASSAYNNSYGSTTIPRPSNPVPSTFSTPKRDFSSDGSWSDGEDAEFRAPPRKRSRALKPTATHTPTPTHRQVVALREVEQAIQQARSVGQKSIILAVKNFLASRGIAVSAPRGVKQLCPISDCTDGPMTPGNFGRHIAGSHLQAIAQYCPGCTNTFSRRDALLRHQKNGSCQPQGKKGKKGKKGKGQNDRGEGSSGKSSA